MGPPRVVVLSQRGAAQRFWYASQYEFEDVIATVEDAVVIAPAMRDTTSTRRLARSGANLLRPRFGLAPSSGLESTAVTTDADLFFGVFASAHDLGHLASLRGWRDRCSVKIAFLVELWTTQLSQYRPYLELLRGFDHVFLFSRDAQREVQRIAGVPCSYLPTATDVLRFAPPLPPPARAVDVHSYGRHLTGTHQALLRAHEANRLCYLFPTLDTGKVTDYREHRIQLAAVLQRSRYTVVYRNNDNIERVRKTGGEESLTNRYFEALAAGSVVLGSAPRVSDFAEQLGWTDAVIDVGAPALDIEQVIADLDADPDRIARARRANVSQSLRRHDWAHRWQVVLSAAGMTARPTLEQRLQALSAAADAVDASPSFTSSSPPGLRSHPS